MQIDNRYSLRSIPNTYSDQVFPITPVEGLRRVKQGKKNMKHFLFKFCEHVYSQYFLDLRYIPGRTRLNDLHISLNSKREKKNHCAQASWCLSSIPFPVRYGKVSLFPKKLATSVSSNFVSLFQAFLRPACPH